MTTSKTLTASVPYIQTRHNRVHVHILSDLHVLTCIAVMYMHSQVQPYKTDQTSVYMPGMSARAHVIKFRKKVKKEMNSVSIQFFFSIGRIRKSAILFLLFSLQTVWYHVIAGRKQQQQQQQQKVN